MASCLKLPRLGKAFGMTACLEPGKRAYGEMGDFTMVSTAAGSTAVGSTAVRSTSGTAAAVELTAMRSTSGTEADDESTTVRSTSMIAATVGLTTLEWVIRLGWVSMVVWTLHHCFLTLDNLEEAVSTCQLMEHSIGLR